MIEARDLVNFASDAAFAIDRDRTIIAWNHRARELLGYTNDDVVGQRCSDALQAVLSGGEPLCVPGCEAVQCFRQANPFSARSIRARHKNGEWVSINLSSLVTGQQDRSVKDESVVAIVFMRPAEEQSAQRPQGRTLQIFTLGPFGMAAGARGISVDKWRRKQAATLLKYLVTCVGRAVRQETLIEQLWPGVDEEQGRGRLKVTVYFLRCELRAADMSEGVLETVGKAYVLRRDRVWIDAHAFEQLIAEGSAHQDKQSLDEALNCYEEAFQLYRGDYMEEDLYADWCAVERERLREVHSEMLTRMVDCHALQGHFAKAAQVCRTALVRDVCRENFHFALMDNLARLGRIDQAAAQYQRCKKILAEELGVEPMPETQLLYQEITGNRIKSLDCH